MLHRTYISMRAYDTDVLHALKFGASVKNLRLYALICYRSINVGDDKNVVTTK